MQMDIIELARRADIHRITPLSPSMIAALERFALFAAVTAGEDVTKQKCIDIIMKRVEATNSPPMKSALLSAVEDIKNC